MPEELRILIVEDVAADADAIEQELARAGLRVRARRVQTREEFTQELQTSPPHLVLSDFTLPDFDGLEALRLVQQHRPDIPFILVTSPRSEEVAVECIREGASDYILKSSLRRLPSAVTTALEKRAAEEAKAQAEQTLRDLSRLILEAQEVERRRVARDLHDSVNQILSSAKFRLEALEERFAARDPTAIRETARTKELLARAITEVRRISRNLRPSELDDLGLIPAIRSLGSEFSDRSGIVLKLDLAGAPSSLPDEVELNVYRVVQEALNNVERHSGAHQAAIGLRHDGGHLRVTIQDDGTGFCPDKPNRRRAGKPRMGLMDMKERAKLLGGQFQVISAPGQGTRVQMEVPVTKSAASSHASREKRHSETHQPAAGR
jgi:signal transduction histidine kinase